VAARFKTFTAGSVLTASEVNTYLAKQAVINCDSSSDYPSAPVVGMTVYDLADDALYIYAGATSGWQPPWNLPWGQVASATTSTATTSISSSYSDLTGLSVTWTAVANRRYKVTGYSDLSSTSASIARLAITDGSANVKAQAQQALAANDVAAQTVFELFTGTAGSTTRKLRGLVTAGTGATQSNAYGPHLILVEDIGPAGAPS
jgi:hypothetical protein